MTDDSIDAIRDAARLACERLDETFPGAEHGGITSNFKGVLEEVIGVMLAGIDPISHRRGHHTYLPVILIRGE